MTAILRITYDEADGLLALAPVESDRFTYHGFGTFLCDVESEEVEITQEALDIILAQPERDGLQGVEFWADKRIAWGSRGPLIVSPSEINVPNTAKIWIKELFVLVEG